MSDDGNNEDNFVLVTGEESGEGEKMEIPLEDDGSLLLATVSHAFDGAVGLKYKNPKTGAFRVLKINSENIVSPPKEGWGNGETLFYVIYHKVTEKRKLDDGGNDGGAAGKIQAPKLSESQLPGRKCSDLIALGLPYSLNEDELRTYFEQYGEMVVAQIKRNHETGKSKGFGFIRFSSYESQLKALSSKHIIDGRPVTVKIPDSQEKVNQMGEFRKVFVGRVPESMTEEELKEFFGKKGEVSDIFIPKPYRAFAFITFVDPEVAQDLCGQDFTVNGHSLCVKNPAPIKSKEEKERAAREAAEKTSYGSRLSGYAGFGESRGKRALLTSDSPHSSSQQSPEASWGAQGGYGGASAYGGYGYGYPWGYYNAGQMAGYGQSQQNMYGGVAPQGVQPPPSNGSSSGTAGQASGAMSVTPAQLQAAVQAALTNVMGPAGAQRAGNTGYK